MLAYMGQKFKNSGEALNFGVGNMLFIFLVVQVFPNAVVQLVDKIYPGFKFEEVSYFCN